MEDTQERDENLKMDFTTSTQSAAHISLALIAELLVEVKVLRVQVQSLILNRADGLSDEQEQEFTSGIEKIAYDTKVAATRRVEEKINELESRIRPQLSGS